MTKIIFSLLIASSFAQGKDHKRCDIFNKKTGDYMGDFEGVCNRANAPGVGADKDLTDLVQNTEKEAELKRAEKAAEDERVQKESKKARRKKVEASCALAEGIVKDLCDEVLDAK